MIWAIVAGFSYTSHGKMPFLIAAVSLSIAFLLSLVNHLRNEKRKVRV